MKVFSRIPYLVSRIPYRASRLAYPTFLIALLAIFYLVPFVAFAHEVRPAYLELREVQNKVFDVLWKTPMRGNRRLALEPEFSGRTEFLAPVTTRESGGAAVQMWRMKAIEPLCGQMLQIRELEGTMTDALARIEFADGTSWVQRFTPANPAATIPVEQSGWGVAGEYSTLGVEHILLGMDHLLFVLALLMITRGTMRLIQTITAFTVAHSITLGLATLGFVHVPSKPVEALIALSIVFVALEIVKQKTRGVIGDSHLGSHISDRSSPSLTVRKPWIIAFIFGLLHGFGFAGALSEVGLPQNHIPLALLFFNIGVEAGQLLFIAAVLGWIAIVRRVRIPSLRWAAFVPPYAIGSVAMFWVIDRLSGF